MATTPNMGLGVLYVGQPDPAWETSLITTINTIDSHSHDGAGHGVKIAFNNLNFTAATPSLAGQPLTQAKYYAVTQQATLQSPAAGIGVLEVDTSGNLYYVSQSSQVLLASSTSINYTSTAKGFVGDYGNTGTPTTGGAAWYNQANGAGKLTTFYFTQKYNPVTGDFYTDPLASLAFASGYMTGTLPKFVVADSSSADTSNSPWNLGYIGTSSGLGFFGIQATKSKGQPAAPVGPILVWENAYSQQNNFGSNQYQPATLMINANPGGVHEAIDNNVALAVHATTAQGSGYVPISSWFAYNSAVSVGTYGQHVYGGQYAGYISTTSTAAQIVFEHYWASTSGSTLGAGRWRPLFSSTGVTQFPRTAVDMQANNSGSVNMALGGDYGGGVTSSAIQLLGSTSAGNIIPVTNNTYNIGAASTGLWANGYFSNLNTGNLTVTGTLTFSGSITTTSFVPTAGWTAGQGFGVYTNVRCVAAGNVVIASNSGTWGASNTGGTITSQTGYNVSSASMVGGITQLGKNGNSVNITLTTAINNGSTYIVLCTIQAASSTGSPNYGPFQVYGSVSNTTTINLITLDPSGTGPNGGTNLTYTIQFLVQQVG